MAKFKPLDYFQQHLIPVNFLQQILPGSIEYAIHYLVDNKLKSVRDIEKRYNNDKAGAWAYDPRVLLKIILFGYFKGVYSSRRLAELCESNIQFIALAANYRPHFTTIAHFISGLKENIKAVFRDILMVCDEEGLLSEETFALDGCKIKSNSSKEWSGTKCEFEMKKQKFERIVSELISKHKTTDEAEESETKTRWEKERKY